MNKRNNEEKKKFFVKKAFSSLKSWSRQVNASEGNCLTTDEVGPTNGLLDCAKRQKALSCVTLIVLRTRAVLTKYKPEHIKDVLN